MDISETTTPKSDQQQYDDYLAGKTRIVTVSAVTKGSPEQPVNVELSEYPGRPFRPNKTMRRLMVIAWGADSTAYVGRRLELCGNPTVVFGGKPVGGVEISAMSHIDAPMTVALTATRGKRKNFTVKPLTEPAQRNWLEELKLAGSNIDAVVALGGAARTAGADASVIATLLAKHAELKAGLTSHDSQSRGARV